MKKILAAATILVMLVTMLTGCGNGGTENEGSNEEDVIRIGWIGPLTGDGAPWGKAELNAIKMLVDETNEKGGVKGKKLELYNYDNRMDSVETTNAGRRIIDQDKVVAILGTNSSSASIALAGVCDSSKVPQIATTATNPAVTVKDNKARPYTFSVQFTDPQQGIIMVNFATQELGAKTAAILYEIGNDFSLGVSQFFEQYFKENGGTITTIEAYKSGDVDFRAQLSKIKGTNPDVIFIPALYKEVGLAANQARSLGISCQLLGTDSWLTYDLFTVASDAVEGSYLVGPIDLKDPTLDDFKARYNAKYGFEPGAEGGNAFLAHDAFMVLLDALNRADSFTGESIRDAIEATKDVDCLTGKISINKDTHQPIKDGFVFKIENKDFVFEKRVKF